MHLSLCMKFYWGGALNNQNKESFFFGLCELLHFLLDLCCIVDVGAQGVVFLRPFDSSSEWISWRFSAIVVVALLRFCESRKSFFGVNKSPVLLFVTSRRFVSVCVSNGSLLKTLLGFWKDKVFNLCVSCVLCSRVLCAFFFLLLVESCFYLNSRICELCVFCVATTKGSWRRGDGCLGVKSRGWDVRI